MSTSRRRGWSFTSSSRTCPVGSCGGGCGAAVGALPRWPACGMLARGGARLLGTRSCPVLLCPSLAHAQCCGCQARLPASPPLPSVAPHRPAAPQTRATATSRPRWRPSPRTPERRCRGLEPCVLPWGTRLWSLRGAVARAAAASRPSFSNARSHVCQSLGAPARLDLIHCLFIRFVHRSATQRARPCRVMHRSLDTAAARASVGTGGGLQGAGQAAGTSHCFPGDVSRKRRIKLQCSARVPPAPN